MKRILIIVYVLIIPVILTCCNKSDKVQNNQDFFIEEIQIDTDIIYNKNMEVYDIYAYKTSSKYFHPSIEGFFLNDNVSYNELRNRLVRITNKNDLLKINDFNFRSFPEEYFEDNLLGLILIQFNGLQYPKNFIIADNDSKLSFSVEIWDQRAEAVPALANCAVYLIKIPRET